jgi:uncharacterized protein (DUF486 family)
MEFAFLHPVYMIRNGTFGTDYWMKFLLAIVGLLVCLYDWKVKRRGDYFWVYTVGLALAFTCELGLVFLGTRAIVRPVLFGSPLPVWSGIFLRAASEASAVTVAGLLLGDLLMDKKSRLKGAVILFILCVIIAVDTLLQALPAKAIGQQVASRRDMTALATLIGLFVIMVFDAVWLWKANKIARRRGLYLVLAITFFTSFWTVCQYLANTRWIETRIGGSLVQASPVLTVFAFIWDILPETSLLYLPFLTIPYIFGKIKSPVSNPVCGFKSRTS